MTRPRRMLAQAAAIIAATLMIGATPAHAWTAYDARRAIMILCANGTLFAYSGRRADVALVGPRLCSGHGGIAGDDGSNPRIVGADRDFMSHWLRYCRGGGVEVRTAFGPARRVTCDLPVYPDGSQPRSHNTSRSNVRG